MSAVLPDYHIVEVSRTRLLSIGSSQSVEAVYDTALTLPNDLKYIVLVLIPFAQPSTDILTTASSGIT